MSEVEYNGLHLLDSRRESGAGLLGPRGEGGPDVRDVAGLGER